jgi:hypothetical protein
MVLDLPKHQLEEAKVYFQSQGIEAWRIGQVISGKQLVFQYHRFAFGSLRGVNRNKSTGVQYDL